MNGPLDASSGFECHDPKCLCKNNYDPWPEEKGAPAPTRGNFFRGFVTATLVWLIVCLFVVACPAQAPLTAVGAGAFNYGYVTDTARVELEQAWDTKNPRQAERGYCIEPSDVEVDTTADHANILWRVHHVSPPSSVVLATPYAISFRCSDDAIASIHTHTPTTCTHEPGDPLGLHPEMCVFGGNDSALCSVDEQDRMSAQHDAFMIVQCDRRAFIFYWPGKRG